MKKILIFCITGVLFGALGYSNEIKENSQQNPQRFQEPTFPYPYNVEEVIFYNTLANITLSGTFTFPDAPGPFPVVILLHGSAPLDRDSSMFGHKPFLVWADHLTKQGIAVLRFDKRSAGKSTGNYDDSTIEDFAADALAAVDYVKTRKEINPHQIGFIGHSEGGMTAILASSLSDDIAFIVLMASPCVNWEELVLEQETTLQRVDGIAEEIIVKNQHLRKEVLAVVKEESDREIAQQHLGEVLTRHFSKLTETDKQAAEMCYGPIEAQVQLFNSAWYRYNLVYDPATTLQQIKVPLLALNGQKDFIVSSEQNLARIAKMLNEAGHKDHTILNLPEINHAFQTCQTGSLTEFATIQETTSPVVLNIMSEWILQEICTDLRAETM